MVKILFVCLGNICRSPLAEGIFQDLIEADNLENKLSCDSAGTSGWHIGEPPDPRSEDVARENGIVLEHVGRQFSKSDFQDFDYIIAMDRSNLYDICEVKGIDQFDEKNLYLMRDFDDLETGGDVPDPYFGGPEGFPKVFDMLRRSCENLLDHVREVHQL